VQRQQARASSPLRTGKCPLDMRNPASATSITPAHIAHPRINADYPYQLCPLIPHVNFIFSKARSTKREHSTKVLHMRQHKVTIEPRSLRFLPAVSDASASSKTTYLRIGANPYYTAAKPAKCCYAQTADHMRPVRCVKCFIPCLIAKRTRRIIRTFFKFQDVPAVYYNTSNHLAHRRCCKSLFRRVLAMCWHLTQME